MRFATVAAFTLAPGEPDVEVTIEDVPESFAETRFPNPFNPFTILRIEVPEAAHVRLSIYDVLGRAVEHLADEDMAAGTHSAAWNAGGLPGGTYFYVFDAGTFRQVGTMVPMK